MLSGLHSKAMTLRRLKAPCADHDFLVEQHRGSQWRENEADESFPQLLVDAAGRNATFLTLLPVLVFPVSCEAAGSHKQA